MQEMFAQGKQDAINAIAAGHGANMESFVTYYADEVKNKFQQDISTKEDLEKFNIKEHLEALQDQIKDL